MKELLMKYGLSYRILAWMLGYKDYTPKGYKRLQDS